MQSYTGQQVRDLFNQVLSANELKRLSDKVGIKEYSENQFELYKKLALALKTPIFNDVSYEDKYGVFKSVYKLVKVMSPDELTRVSNAF